MKTIEEKAKAYDEALERAKAYHRNELSGSRKEMMEYIFPQLRESEDERIRKWLLECVENLSDGNFIEVSKRDVLFYLEKQKEQKPTDYPYLPGWRKNRDDNKPELKRSVLMLTTHGVAEGEWLGKKWCQYRWSCELKDDDVLYWMHLSDLVRLEKQDEQKEQKPAEWSEEDKRILKGIIGKIDHDQTYGVSKSEMLNFLEDLRPSWKPLKQQMDALHEAVIRACSHHYGVELLSLEIDLHNLK